MIMDIEKVMSSVILLEISGNTLGGCWLKLVHKSFLQKLVTLDNMTDR